MILSSVKKRKDPRKRARSSASLSTSTTLCLLMLASSCCMPISKAVSPPKEGRSYRKTNKNGLDYVDDGDESGLLNLYVSEDEETERILSAMAKIDDEYTSYAETSSSYTDILSDALAKEEDIRLLPRPSRGRRDDVTSKAVTKQGKLSQVAIPETYRAKTTSSFLTSLPPVSTRLPPPVAKLATTLDKAPDVLQQHRITAMNQRTSPWIRRFLASCPDDSLLPLPLDFLMDNFNLAQLPAVVERIALQGLSDTQRRLVSDGVREAGGSQQQQQYPLYQQARQLMIQQVPPPPAAAASTPSNALLGRQSTLVDGETTTIPVHLETATRVLYMLLHQRFCVSPRGLDMVRRRFAAAGLAPVFGSCPNPACRNMPLLPCGASDNYHSSDAVGKTAVNGFTTPTADTPPKSTFDYYCQRYCCQCKQVFVHTSSMADGCAWGPSFCHLFVMTYGKQFMLDLRKKMKQSNASSSFFEKKYRPALPVDPRIFGFRLHPSTGQ